MKNAFPFEKISLGQIEKCYSALGLEIDGAPALIFGGEGEGSVQIFRGDHFETRDQIWTGGGGTMSIVPYPGKEGFALISRGFYSMVDCEGSTVEILRYGGGVFTHEPIARLPYLHRFDTLLSPDGTRYLFAAALHGGKADKADWSKPGRLFFGALPSDPKTPFHVSFTALPGEYFINHGFFKGSWEGREAAFTASQEGVFVTLPPKKAGGAWETRRLLDFPVSDIAVGDVDGDGEMEIAALLPFHGDRMKIFHRDGGTYREVFAYPAENDFYHAIVFGSVHGEPLFIGGARKKAADLFLVRFDRETGAYFTQCLESGSGPSNLSLLNSSRGDFLLCANRMVFEAAVYKFL